MNYAKLRGFLAAAAAVLSLSLLPAITPAQTQDSSSVADAARKAREQKKTAPKAVRTVTNDDLPAAPAAAPADAKPAATSGEPATTEEGKPAPADTGVAEKKEAADKQTADEKLAEKKAELEAALKQAKADLAQNEHELDVLQRLQTLDNDSHYSQTDYQADTTGKAKLDADAQQIGDKKSRIETIKAKVAELMAELDLAGDAEPKKPAADQPK